MRSSTTVDATGSSPAVGSSYMITRSLLSFSSHTTALASATRFFMPPDSSFGKSFCTPRSPTLLRLSSTMRSMSSGGSCECSYRRNPTFSPTVSESNSAAFWKTMPTRRCSSSVWSDSRPVRLWPMMDTSPESGASRPAAMRSVVDLPVPLAPMMPTASPRRIWKLAPCKMALSPNAL
mmetsp:Transcript_45380/g.135399  ORF Transcript_45380/g.135399 Transcript_45380/m.135399 type:complete len:178 (-) Transcript_45380:203-736(-)